jgi:hypothetical protein
VSRGRRAGVLAAALALAAACSPAVSAPDETSARPVAREAWTVEDHTTGVRVLLEPLTPAAATAPVAVSEEELLARVVPLGPGQVWFRVHELGAAATGAAGRVTRAGAALAAPPLRAQAALRDRLLYLALVRGGEAATGVDPRRIRLLAGDARGDGAFVWERDGLRLELRARSWTDRERADFLGDSTAHAASESPGSALPEPTDAHE